MVEIIKGNWVWARDVQNQYVFHMDFKDATHQIEFEKNSYSSRWIRKRRIMKIINDGYVNIRYCVFNKDYKEAIFTTEKKVNINEVKSLFGLEVYNKILAIY